MGMTMSFKYAVQKVSDNHYVLPKIGSMKMDVHAFLSEALYEASDEQVWQQIVNGASYEGVLGAYLMPDTHVGYGVPVGSVIVTDDTIIQGGSGYDISCGVLYMKARPQRRRRSRASTSAAAGWTEVERRVATGKGHTGPTSCRSSRASKGDDILRYGAKALGVQRRSVRATSTSPCPTTSTSRNIERAYTSVVAAAGSVGGGNHFVEMQCRPRLGRGLRHGPLRQPRVRLADRQPLLLRGGARLRGLPKNRREDSWLHADEPLGQEYWAHHNSAANFAVANRHIIVEGIRGGDARGLRRGRRGLLRDQPQPRAGGDARPAGRHDEEGLRAPQGRDARVPGGSPGPRGYAAGRRRGTRASSRAPCTRALRSCSRCRARTRARAASTTARGAFWRAARPSASSSTSSSASTTRWRPSSGPSTACRSRASSSNHRHVPLDECAHVYKDLDEVLAVLEAEDIARVAHRLYPVANIKGAD